MDAVVTDDAHIKQVLEDLMAKFPDTGFVIIRSKPLKDKDQMNQRAWTNIGNKEALRVILENELKMLYVGEN